MKQYTSGPWKAVATPTRKDTAYTICTTNEAPFQAVICDVDKSSAHHKQHEYAPLGNAQLIAAAPDLLEACKCLVEAFECAGRVYGGNVPATGAMVDAGIKAKAAVTKATKGTL